MINKENIRSDTEIKLSGRALFSFEKQLSVSDITRALHSAGLIAVPRAGIYEIRRAKK